MTASFARALEAAPRPCGRPVLRWPAGQIAWADLDAWAAGVADHLDEAGVEPGDRVALALPNGPEFVAALLGTWKLGATACPLNPQLTGAERQLIERDLVPRAWLATAPARRGRRPAPAAARGPALVLYTSGSTGRPRGAVLSHAALEGAIRSWVGPVMALEPGDVVLGVLPFAHSFGLCGALLAPLLAGAAVVTLPRFTPEAVLATIPAEGITVFPGVATMFAAVIDAPAFSPGALAPLRLAVAGAAPCPWELARRWREATGCRILRGYGMTELFRPISYRAKDATDVPERVGEAVPGVELCVVDEDGRPQPAGTVGELWIRTPWAMDGYLGAPEETAAVLAGGWFRTGDLASLDARGRVRIAGRKKELILRGGYSVSPREVESVLLGHPDVAEAAVAGVTDARLGEEIVAFVALRPGARPAAESLLAFCRERLAAYKAPRRVVFVEALPRSATGKVLRSHLADPGAASAAGTDG